MNDIYEVLTKELLEKNDKLSYAQARAWVEYCGKIFKRLMRNQVVIKEKK